jgi:phospholipid-binding lipoprotein MlaA
MRNLLGSLLAVPCLLLLTGCSYKPRPFPLEGVNKKVFWFNDQLDIHALEPVARGWHHLWPDPVERGFNNFFDNLRFPIVIVNDILQGEPRWAYETVARFSANTILGGLGFVDIASERGIPPHIQDTGLTLGRWGVPPGDYIVLPFFGPSNVRDTFGFAGDLGLAIYPFFVTIPGITVAAAGIDVVNRRATYLDEVSAAKAASVDYYSFAKDAYMQRRAALVRGETPTDTRQQDELYDTEIYEDFIEEGQ